MNALRKWAALLRLEAALNGRSVLHELLQVIVIAVLVAAGMDALALLGIAGGWL